MRYSMAVVAGVLAGVLLLSSIQGGVGLMFMNEDPTERWSMTRWGDHWAWRTVWGLVATFGGAFIAGMIARRHGARVGLLTALPSVAVWIAIAYVGFTGWAGRGKVSEDLLLPLGWRIAAVALVLLSIPAGIAGGRAGAPYGAVNGAAYDARRGALLGVRAPHFIWLPFAFHLVVIVTAGGAMYALGWIVEAWSAGIALYNFVPFLFAFGIFTAVQFAWRGAWRAYLGLAGFDDDDSGPRLRRHGRATRVFVHGVMWPLGAAAALFAIALVQAGLAKLFG